ncbi:hypothetical protein [Mucilaginibacter gynuensis]|uniref:hypothetical protein n=1 Tax=Mucilaginibacter gynuensis TaxID=1302236 RepID=UPI0031E8D2EC
MRVHDILPRQQEASGENGQNFGGHERKGGHRSLLHVGRNSGMGQKFQPKVLHVLQGMAMCGKEAFCWTSLFVIFCGDKSNSPCGNEQTTVNYSTALTRTAETIIYEPAGGEKMK